jgi:hypothetical protein
MQLDQRASSFIEIVILLNFIKPKLGTAKKTLVGGKGEKKVKKLRRKNIERASTMCVQLILAGQHLSSPCIQSFTKERHGGF